MRARKRDAGPRVESKKWRRLSVGPGASKSGRASLLQRLPIDVGETILEFLDGDGLYAFSKTNRALADMYHFGTLQRKVDECVKHVPRLPDKLFGKMVRGLSAAEIERTFELKLVVDSGFSTGVLFADQEGAPLRWPNLRTLSISAPRAFFVQYPRVSAGIMGTTHAFPALRTLSLDGVCFNPQDIKQLPSLLNLRIAQNVVRDLKLGFSSLVRSCSTLRTLVITPSKEYSLGFILELHHDIMHRLRVFDAEVEGDISIDLSVFKNCRSMRLKANLIAVQRSQFDNMRIDSLQIETFKFKHTNIDSLRGSIQNLFVRYYNLGFLKDLERLIRFGGIKKVRVEKIAPDDALELQRLERMLKTMGPSSVDKFKKIG